MAATLSFEEPPRPFGRDELCANVVSLVSETTSPTVESPHGTSEMAHVAAGAPTRPFWKSQRSYILASVAGVVGLGNIWRFPYMAGQNGGGTFVLAYAICILAIGIPIAVIEASAGNLYDRGPVGLFRHLNTRWGPLAGWFLVAMLVAIMSYYLVVSGWTLGYAVDSVRGELRTFDEFTAGSNSLWYLFAIGALCLLVLLRGIRGLEATGRVLLPMLVVIVGGLAIYAQSLPGAAEARAFYFHFDGEILLHPHIWRMAASQAFYSLAIGQGMLITYGSYVPDKVNVVTSSTAVALTNAAVSITAGLMVFPIVFTFGIAPDAGSALSFTAFPNVFGALAGGRLIGVAFYVLLFAAAFSSCIGGLVVVLAPIRDELRLSRPRAALVAVGITVALGVPSALSFSSYDLCINGIPFLDFMDLVTGSGVVIVAGILGAALISWMIPRNDLFNAMNAPVYVRGQLRYSAGWMIAVARYLPVAAIMLIVVGSLF